MSLTRHKHRSHLTATIYFRFLIALLLASAWMARAQPLVVSNMSPVFVLDTRLPMPSTSQSNLVVQIVSLPFTLDLRLPAATGVNSNLVAQAVSPRFSLDLRIISVTPPAGSTIFATSGVFTVNTLLSV